MADYQNPVRSGAGYVTDIDAGLRAYMLRVYNYMLAGLVVSGVVAWVVATVPAVQAVFFQMNAATGQFQPTVLMWIALFAPLGLVLFMGFRIQQMRLSSAKMTFWVFAALMGISLAPTLLFYTGVSVARVFFITAATFGAMSLWGYTTKRDLTGFGHFLMMGLIGIIIAMVVNIFLHSTQMNFIVSILGVGIFTGLTAYDTQNIKEMYSVSYDGEMAGKTALMGALRLYLDFINLFMMLMRLMGDRR
jgi:hypothetical protein